MLGTRSRALREWETAETATGGGKCAAAGTSWAWEAGSRAGSDGVEAWHLVWGRDVAGFVCAEDGVDDIAEGYWSGLVEGLKVEEDDHTGKCGARESKNDGRLHDANVLVLVYLMSDVLMRMQVFNERVDRRK